MSNESMTITVGARDSLLSKTQVREVLEELRVFYPHICFCPIYMKTLGDIDLQTSLRSLEKTDFFTREIDTLLLEGKCRIAIHSAKDLPDPLPKGLVIAALTKGKDPSDSLVLRENESFEGLAEKSKIATSSLRREESVRLLRKDLSFVDIRGNIQSRYEKLLNREVDGVVIAEAALLRLDWSVNRIKLPGMHAPFQGRLAVVVQKRDHEMQKLFGSLHEN